MKKEPIKVIGFEGADIRYCNLINNACKLQTLFLIWKYYNLRVDFSTLFSFFALTLASATFGAFALASATFGAFALIVFQASYHF